MKYCTDTNFLLELFHKEFKAHEIFRKINFDKVSFIIPMLVLNETMKILMQRGFAQYTISAFFDTLQMYQKIKFLSADRLTSEEAAKLSFSFSIGTVDAHIAAIAKLENCDSILSKDSDFKILQKYQYVKVQKW